MILGQKSNELGWTSKSDQWIVNRIGMCSIICDEQWIKNWEFDFEFKA